MLRRVLMAAVVTAAPLHAQTAPTEPAPPETTTDLAADPISVDSGTVLIGGISGGLLARDRAVSSPYSILSVTAYRDRYYLRGAMTFYRSTLIQPDAALPSTYYIGSIGGGGNWDGWVVDAYASYGRQVFGKVETALGARDSLAGPGAPYFATGVRAGRRFEYDRRTLLIATGSLGFASSRSLRHTIGTGQPVDLQVPDQAVTGSLALRIDHDFSGTDKVWLGLNAEHFVTDNGSTVLTVISGPPPDLSAPPAPTMVTDQFMVSKTPDRWTELGLSGSFQAGRDVWFDIEFKRTLGAVSGDSTTATAGIRIRM